MTSPRNTTNVHGLTRTIPEDIKRQVRQECGFGCVICGIAIVVYEHIDPKFSDSKEHDPQKMALLCGACHDRATKGIWSKNKVLEARRNPMTFNRGCARDAFDFKDPFELFVGNNHVRNVRCVIRRQSNEDEWMTIEPPEAPDAPPLLSAKFYDPTGLPALEIRQNEWFCSTGVWDLEVTGPLIVVRTARRQVMLRLKARPPHGLEIQYLKMSFQDTGILVQANGTVRLTIEGTEIEMNGSEISRADAVFSLP